MANKTISAVVIVDRATNRVVFYAPVLGIDLIPSVPAFPNIHLKLQGNLAYDDATDFGINTSFHYKFDQAAGAVSQIADDSDAVMSDLALWNRKFQTNEILLAKISQLRKRVVKDSLYGQHQVYQMKAQQAQAFRQSGYKGADKFPMVMDYAEATGRPPKQAADQILRKARENAGLLRRTEKARMVYKSAVFRAVSFEDLAQVTDNITALSF